MEPVGHAAKLLSDLPARADAAVVANGRAVFKDSVHKKPSQDEVNRFNALLEAVHQRCLEYGLNYTSDMAKRIIDKPALETYADIFPELDHLNGSLSYELEKEAVFRVSPEAAYCVVPGSSISSLSSAFEA